MNSCHWVGLPEAQFLRVTMLYQETWGLRESENVGPCQAAKVEKGKCVTLTSRCVVTHMGKRHLENDYRDGFLGLGLLLGV